MKSVTFFVLLFLSHTYCFSQKTYYVSSQGSDSNEGTSITSPLKTLRELRSGNTYLLKRGDTLYFNVPEIKTVENKDITTISAYGTGEKPVLCLYSKIKPKSWINDLHNIWKVDLAINDNFTGFLSQNYNVGFIKVDRKIYGRKQISISSLSQEWDFYCEGSIMYVYSSRNPSEFTSIETTSNVSVIRLSDRMTISDIKIIGSGAHGISGNNKQDIIIRNVDVTEIGGSVLVGYGNGNVRYGNGIEFYNGCNNCLIEKCTISQVYDTALTMQGDSKTIAFNNVVIKDNVISNNEQSFEIWIRGGGPGFTNCKFINNNCSNAGFGWSHPYRPVQYEGVHLLSYNLVCANFDLVIENNTFFKARSGLYFFLDAPHIPRFTTRNNTITLNANVPIRALSTSIKNLRISVTNYENFVKSTGFEHGSKFNIIPGVSP